MTSLRLMVCLPGGGLCRELVPKGTYLLEYATCHADLRARTVPKVRQFIRDRGMILTTSKELKERRQKAAPL